MFMSNFNPYFLRYTSKSGPSGHSVIDWGGGDNEEGKST